MHSSSMATQAIRSLLPAYFFLAFLSLGAIPKAASQPIVSTISSYTEPKQSLCLVTVFFSPDKISSASSPGTWLVPVQYTIHNLNGSDMASPWTLDCDSDSYVGLSSAVAVSGGAGGASAAASGGTASVSLHLLLKKLFQNTKTKLYLR